jgi:hypothetical protein
MPGRGVHLEVCFHFREERSMKNRLALSVAALAFLVVAMGSGTKVRSFTVVCCESSDADGMAMLTTNPGHGTIDVQVVITGFHADTSYYIGVTSGGGSSDPDANNPLVTNSVGNGNFHSASTAWNGQPLGTVTVTIYGSFTVVDNVPVFTDLRATGSGS